MNHYEALVKHPYVERQNKMFILLNNAELETVETFMIVLDIAEKLCIAVMKCIRNCCQYLKSFIHW